MFVAIVDDAVVKASSLGSPRLNEDENSFPFFHSWLGWNSGVDIGLGSAGITCNKEVVSKFDILSM